MKVFELMEKIWEAKGALIAGIGDSKGRQALQQHASGINRRGGKRVRQPEKDRVHWIHRHAQPAQAQPCMRGTRRTSNRPIRMLTLNQVKVKIACN